MLLDIVILPPPKVRKQVAALTKKIDKKFPLPWRVDNRKLIPHITLYHLETKEKYLPEIYATVASIAKKQKPFPLSFTDIRGGRIAFGITVKNSAQLSALHESALKKLNRNRTGTTALLFAVPPKDLDARNKRYLKKFGVISILRDFWPHITFGMPKSPEQLQNILKFSQKAKFRRCVADTIAVTKINNYFQVIKILKEFKLK